MQDKRITPCDYWGNPNSSNEWIRKANLHRKAGDVSDQKVIKKIGTKFKSVLEVGAGNGRIIGGLSEKQKKVKCHSTDINEKLSEYVKEKYKKVHVYSGSHNIIELPFAANQFDLVYTFQVLQHVVLEDIEKALSELQRVAKKEVWLFEGWGNLEEWGLPNGYMRHRHGGGTFYWDLEKMIKCYSVRFFEKGKDGNTGIKIYKIKVK